MPAPRLRVNIDWLSEVNIHWKAGSKTTELSVKSTVVVVGVGSAEVALLDVARTSRSRRGRFGETRLRGRCPPCSDDGARML